MTKKPKTPAPKSSTCDRIWELAMFGAPLAEMQFALDAGSDIEGRDARGQTALHMAAQRSDVQTLSWLIARGANPNARDSASGSTPLHVACRRAQPLIATALLKAGADPNIVDQANRTPAFELPCDKEMVGLLANFGLDLEIQDRTGSLLHLAAEIGHAEGILNLIALGANIDAPNENGWTPMIMAAAHGRLESLDALLVAGANPHALAHDGQGPLSLAAHCGEHALECMASLLKAGCRLSPKDMKVARSPIFPNRKKIKGAYSPPASSVHESRKNGLALLSKLSETEATSREIDKAIGPAPKSKSKPKPRI